jgi:hypothetical protein
VLRQKCVQQQLSRDCNHLSAASSASTLRGQLKHCLADLVEAGSLVIPCSAADFVGGRRYVISCLSFGEVGALRQARLTNPPARFIAAMLRLFVAACSHSRPPLSPERDLVAATAKRNSGPDATSLHLALAQAVGLGGGTGLG